MLLHLRCVRLGGHAGSDVEAGYRSPAEIAADLLRDPLAATMRALVSTGTLTPAAVRDAGCAAATRSARRSSPPCRTSG